MPVFYSYARGMKGGGGVYRGQKRRADSPKILGQADIELLMATVNKQTAAGTDGQQ